MPASKATISVVIPAYNAESVIGRAVESVLAQSLLPDEVIVMDDGSTDQTRREAEKFGDRIRYIRQDNAGASAARNTGITQARGEWIAFLDGDDEWLPDRLRLAMELLGRHPDLRWVSGNFYRCQCEPEHILTADLADEQVDRVRTFLGGGEVFDSYFTAHQRQAMGYTSTMVFHRDLLVRAGLFLPGQKRMNDVDLWLRVAYLDCRMGYVFEPTAVYHMGVPGSILKMHRDGRHIDQFLERHLALADQAGMGEVFRPFAGALLGHWIWILMKESQGGQIRFLLKKYKRLVSSYNFITNYIQSFCPPLGCWYEDRKKHLRANRRNG